MIDLYHRIIQTNKPKELVPG